MAGPVGIREVAKRANVSIGTVSHVLNKPEIVARQTIERVHAAMDELGFVRNDLARSLRLGSSTTVGMMVLDVANPFFADLAHACESAAEELGYTVIVGSSDGLREREDHYLDLFAEQRVGGLLIAPVAGATDRMRRLHERGVRMVLFDAFADDEFCTVSMDGVAGGELALAHLITTGRRRITFLDGPSYLFEDRWMGARKAVAENPGVDISRIDAADSTVAAGAAAGRQIADMPPHERPDAVFAGTDQLAIGLAQALVLDDRVDAPAEIAIVGYDGIEYASTAIIPLTTVRQPIEAIASEAMRLLSAEDPGSGHRHERVRLSPRLVVRDSTPVRPQRAQRQRRKQAHPHP